MSECLTVRARQFRLHPRYCASRPDGRASSDWRREHQQDLRYWQAHTPFGGFTGKQSGMGRIGGMYTLREMTQLKMITVDVED